MNTMTASLNVALTGDSGASTAKKLRRRLLPLLFLLYIVAYLDRINIGFAALTMNKDLQITSAQFGLLTGIFFWGYFLFEVPSNLMLYKVGARPWIARILMTWGVIAVMTGMAHNPYQLYAARFLLGVAEAGFFPGIVLYLTYWFRQREQAQVIAWFLTGLPVASILGAPVSGFILDHAHWMAVSSWRWLLALEGLPAVICGILTLYLLPSHPAEAKFLTPWERDQLTTEIAREQRQRLGERRLSGLQALANPRVWRLAAISFFCLIGMYSMSFWMPQAVRSLSSGYSNTVVGLLVMVPNLAGVTAMVLVSRSSDRRLERRYHAAVPVIVAGLSLVLLGATRSPWLSIALWSLVAAGIYSFLGPFWSLPGEFLAGYSAASGIALINSIGNLGGFVGPSAIGFMTSHSGGMSGGLALAGVSLFVSAAILLLPSHTHSYDSRNPASNSARMEVS